MVRIGALHGMIFLLGVVLELPSGPSSRAAIQYLILHHQILRMLEQKKYYMTKEQEKCTVTKILGQLSEPEVEAGGILGHCYYHQQEMCVG